MNYYNLIINLALIKRINSIQTYFPTLPAFYALYHIIKNKLSNITIFFIFLIITFSIANYSESISDFNLIRLIQLITLMIFADYSFKFISEKEIELGFKCVAIISSLMILMQHFGENIYDSRFLWIFERVPGLSGEPNYTGATLLSIIIFFLYNKNNKWAFYVFIMGLFSFSRGYIFSSALIIFLIIFKKIKFDYLKHISKIIILVFFLYPFLLHLTFLILPDNLFLKIYEQDVRIKNHLYYYFEVIENKPFGLGVGNNHKYYKNNYKTYVENKLDNKVVYDQHNLPLQILSELGLAFYIIFIIFLIFMLLSINHSWPILLILMPYSFLNGMNEILLYILVPYFIKKERYN